MDRMDQMKRPASSIENYNDDGLTYHQRYYRKNKDKLSIHKHNKRQEKKTEKFEKLEKELISIVEEIVKDDCVILVYGKTENDLAKRIVQEMLCKKRDVEKQLYAHGRHGRGLDVWTKGGNPSCLTAP